MVGLYFSGTGNSKWAINTFVSKIDKNIKTYSIEELDVIDKIKDEDIIIFSYPVMFSNIPKIVKDFFVNNKEIWLNKKFFVIATMGLFSGDGAGLIKRLLKKYNAKTIGGLHLKMPDSIGDEKALKRSLEKNKEIINKALIKIDKSVIAFKNNKPKKEGLNIFYHIAGLFGQRLYFGHKTKHYSNKLKIDTNKCIGCAKCVKICPMNNIKIENNKAKSLDKCTMCYRCINNCPTCAITLLGKRVVEQSVIEKYID